MPKAKLLDEISQPHWYWERQILLRLYAYYLYALILIIFMNFIFFSSSNTSKNPEIITSQAVEAKLRIRVHLLISTPGVSIIVTNGDPAFMNWLTTAGVTMFWRGAVATGVSLSTKVCWEFSVLAVAGSGGCRLSWRSLTTICAVKEKGGKLWMVVKNENNLRTMRCKSYRSIFLRGYQSLQWYTSLL